MKRTDRVLCNEAEVPSALDLKLGYVEKPEAIDISLVNRRNFAQFGGYVSYGSGAGRRRGQRYARIMFRNRPVEYKGQIWNYAFSGFFPVDGSAEPVTFTVANLHAWSRYQLRKERWNALTRTARTKVEQIEELLAGELLIDPELRVQLGEVIDGKEKRFYSARLAQVLHEKLGIGTWDDLRRMWFENGVYEPCIAVIQ